MRSKLLRLTMSAVFMAACFSGIAAAQPSRITLTENGKYKLERHGKAFGEVVPDGEDAQGNPKFRLEKVFPQKQPTSTAGPVPTPPPPTPTPTPAEPVAVTIANHGGLLVTTEPNITFGQMLILVITLATILGLFVFAGLTWGAHLLRRVMGDAIQFAGQSQATAIERAAELASKRSAKATRKSARATRKIAAALNSLATTAQAYAVARGAQIASPTAAEVAQFGKGLPGPEEPKLDAQTAELPAADSQAQT